jgi:hypothetical protein
MGNMKFTLGKWEYKITFGGLKPEKYNIYANSWVRILR